MIDASNPWMLRPERADGASEGLRPAFMATTQVTIRLFGGIVYHRRSDIPDGVAEALILYERHSGEGYEWSPSCRGLKAMTS